MRGGEGLAWDLLSMILGSGETSRLYHEVKDARGLVDSVSAYAYTPKDPGVLIVSATGAPDKAKEALGEMPRADIVAAARKYLTPENLTVAAVVPRGESGMISGEEVRKIATEAYREAMKEAGGGGERGGVVKGGVGEGQ